MLAGVPSRYPSAPSTSAAPAVSAGTTTTSTPSISSVHAPASTDSNMACMAGDGVWCTRSRRRMCGQHSRADRPRAGKSDPIDALAAAHRGWPARAELVRRCRELTVQINALERELRDLVRIQAPGLLALPDCGML